MYLTCPKTVQTPKTKTQQYQYLGLTNPPVSTGGYLPGYRPHYRAPPRGCLVPKNVVAAVRGPGIRAERSAGLLPGGLPAGASPAAVLRPRSGSVSRAIRSGVTDIFHDPQHRGSLRPVRRYTLLVCARISSMVSGRTHSNSSQPRVCAHKSSSV